MLSWMMDRILSCETARRADSDSRWEIIGENADSLHKGFSMYTVASTSWKFQKLCAIKGPVGVQGEK